MYWYYKPTTLQEDEQEPCYRRENRAMHFAITAKPTSDCTSPIRTLALSLVSEEIATDTVSRCVDRRFCSLSLSDVHGKWTWYTNHKKIDKIPVSGKLKSIRKARV